MSIIPLRRPSQTDDSAARRAPYPDGIEHIGADAGRAAAGVRLRSAAPVVDEAELDRRLAAGDPAALTAISAWLWESLAAYAYRIVEDRDAAMDIAQEACLRLWQRRSQETRRSLRPYLYRITRNLALDQVKTKRTRRRLLLSHEPGYGKRPTTPDEVLEQDGISERVHRAIQELPERRRDVFVLAYLRGLSYAEVGDVLGISPKTVQNQMTAALAQLRTTLRPLLDERRADQPEAGHDER